MYVATWTSPARIVAVRLTDMTQLGELGLEPGEGAVRVLLLDAGRGLLYAATFTTPPTVVKVRVDGAGGLQRETAVVLAGEAAIASGILDQEGTHGYFGTNSAPGVLLKVQLALPQREPRAAGRIALRVGEDSVYTALRDGPHGLFATRAEWGGSVLVRVHLETFSRMDEVRLPQMPNISAGALERPSSGRGDGSIILGTWTSPAKLLRLRLGLSFGRKLPAPAPLTLPHGSDNVFALATLPGVAVATLAGSSTSALAAEVLALLPLPVDAEAGLGLLRTHALPAGRAARTLAVASEHSVVVGAHGGALAALTLVDIGTGCNEGGCICAAETTSAAGGARGCPPESATVTFAPQRTQLPSSAAAGAISALAIDSARGVAYAATWGDNAGGASQLIAVDAATMLPFGEPTTLRAAFGGFMDAERQVSAVHVASDARLLLAVAGRSRPSTVLQYRIQADGRLSRRQSLGAPAIEQPALLSLLDAHAKPAARLYIVLQQTVEVPPELLLVDALSLQVESRLPLRQGDGQGGCGLVLPNGDVLLASEGSSVAPVNTSDLVGGAGENAYVARFRPAANGGMERLVDARVPTTEVSCALADPSGDAAYIGSASSPAVFVKLDTGRWSSASAVGALQLQLEEGPIAACALDSERKVAYLGTGGADGRVIAISLATFTRKAGLVRVPGFVMAAVPMPTRGSILFATSTRAPPPLPEGLLHPRGASERQVTAALSSASTPPTPRHHHHHRDRQHHAHTPHTYTRPALAPSPAPAPKPKASPSSTLNT